MRPCAPLRASWIKKLEVVEVPGCPVPGPCWIWHGCRDKVTGYGRVYVNKRTKYLHREVYEMLVGPVPNGLHADHLCRQRACCAPYHLEPVTPLVNVRRSPDHHAAKTHCPNGHPYSGDNLYIAQRPGGIHRTCRQCRDAAVARHRAKRKAQRETTWAKYAHLLEPASVADRGSAA